MKFHDKWSNSDKKIAENKNHTKILFAFSFKKEFTCRNVTKNHKLCWSNKKKNTFSTNEKYTKMAR